MQRAAFTAEAIAATYELFDVAPDALATTLAALHREGYAGLNLTAPLKERAWPHLADATPEAERLRSVNTLIRCDAGWRGDVTDGAGFAAWAREAAVPFRGAAVALLGSGGAARAIAAYMGSLGAAAVVVGARHVGRAEALVGAVAGGGAGTEWGARLLSDGRPGRTITVLVRALSTGAFQPEESAWWDAVAPGGMVIDLNYGSLAAATRARAAASGIRFDDGRGMLLHQGALAFERWTGRKPPLEAMRRALEAATA